MKKIYCIAFVALFCGLTKKGIAQAYIANTDSVKAIKYVAQSNQLLDLNTDSALVYANKSLQIAEKHNNPYLLALAKDQLGVVLQQAGNWKKAIQLFDQAIQIREQNNWISEAGQSYMHLGTLYLREGEMFELRGSFNAADKSYERALVNCKKALQKVTSVKDTLWMAKTHVSTGAAFYRLYQNDSALTHFKTSIRLYHEAKISGRTPAVFSNIGIIYQSMGQLDSAALYYNNARQLFMDQANVKNWVNVNINLASLYEETNPNKAITWLTEADSLASLSNFKVQQAQVQEYLYKIYNDQNQYKQALRHLEKYQMLKDSILNSDFKTEELQVRYQTAKQKELIERQKAENLKKELALAKSNAVKNKLKIVAIAASLLLILIVVVFYWRQRLMKKLNLQKEKLHSKELLELEQAKKLDAAKAMLAGQEKERIRIAEDLHDRLGSTLIATRMQFEVGMDNLEKDNKYLSKAQLLLDQAINDSREISHNMISGVLVKLGLKAALSELKNGLESTGQLSLILNLNELERLPGNTEIQLYRIVQELINNAIRHSQATQISLACTKQNQHYCFTCKNNGKGFDPKATSQGIGLRNIKSRVANIGGTLNIESNLAQGSTFTIQFSSNEK